MRVFVQKVDHSVELLFFDLTFEKEKTTRETFRDQLTKSPLGEEDRDIFFPEWTSSPLMMQGEDLMKSVPTWEEIEESKITVDSDEKLQELLDKEEAFPGTTALVVQQTRSRRYSRKSDSRTQTRQDYNNSRAVEAPHPIYLEPSYMPVSVIGPIPSPHNPYYPPYNPNACYAIPVFNFGPGSVLVPTHYQGGQYYQC